MEIKMKETEITAQPSLSVRKRTSVVNLPDAIHSAYDAVAGHINGINARCTGAPFVIYYNMDMNDLDVEMGFPVDKTYGETDTIRNSEIPGGKVLEFTHIGPYNELEKTYTRAMEHISRNKIETTGVVCESYANDPAVTPPAELRTDIRFYLKN